MPNSMETCSFVIVCNGLTERRVVEAVERGARSHEEVYEKCDCIAQCFACADEIDGIVLRATTPRSGARPLPIGDNLHARSI